MFIWSQNCPLLCPPPLLSLSLSLLKPLFCLRSNPDPEPRPGLELELGPVLLLDDEDPEARSIKLLILEDVDDDAVEDDIRDDLFIPNPDEYEDDDEGPP